MYKNSFIHYLTKIAVDVMFYVGIPACLASPFWVVWRENVLGYGDGVAYPVAGMIFMSGVCAVYILWQLKVIFKTLTGGNPFVMRNVNCLRKISVAGALIAAIYFVKCAFFFSPASLVVCGTFAGAALFCLTLKDVFKQAVHYKEENDATI